MKDKIKELANCLVNVYNLEHEIGYDKEYWLNKAKDETDFVPDEKSWISVEVKPYKIEVYVYSEAKSKYWINGVWVDDPFSREYPNILQFALSLS